MWGETVSLFNSELLHYRQVFMLCLGAKVVKYSDIGKFFKENRNNVKNKKQAAFHNVACFKNGLFKSSYVHTWYVRRLHIHRLISPNLVVTVLCHTTQFLLDTDKLVVLCHTVGTRE